MTEELSCINSSVLMEDINGSNNMSSNSEKSDDSDGDNEIRFTKAKPKLKRLTESDSDTGKENYQKKINIVSSPQNSDSDSSNGTEVISVKKKSRIRNLSNSDSESLSGIDNKEASSNYDLTRTKIRNKVLQDKFKKLKQPKHNERNDDQSSAESGGKSTDNSSDGEVSCTKIKQKFKKKSSHSLTAICDPDTSDDESSVHVKDVKVQKSKPRSIKLTSPKPARMSAKQAMENMQKIKSESNRMLREKEVSLPYHRPKALNLKDIMNRRKPALTSEGKSLPIKMNNEQLKQYALMLEQRQKEMMELCKSDTEEEEQNCEEEQQFIDKSEDNLEISGIEPTSNQENCDSSDVNDQIYDDINMEHSVNHSTDCNNLNMQDVQEAVIVSDTLENNNSKTSETKTDNVQDEQEQPMEISILHENNTSPLNCSNKDTVDTTEKQDEAIDQPSDNELHLNSVNKDSEQESQVISLHYDSEKTDVTNSQHAMSDLEKPGQSKNFQDVNELESNDQTKDNNSENTLTLNERPKNNLSDEFSDNDFTMEELEEIIEKAEVNKGSRYKPLPNIETTLEMKPILTGAPGMVIDLDDDSQNENTQKKLTGVEILKERFKYFANLKSLEEMEKDREKKFKPGIQHLKLKQKLEEEIAEQRSLEWEKRLQAENELKSEINTVEGEEFDGDDIEKIEAKLEENDIIDEDEESSSEEEIEETDLCDIKDKPRIRNALIDDEAEESEDEDVENVGDGDCNKEGVDDNDGEEENKGEDSEDDSEDDDDEDSSESEEEKQETKCRKGRILKAFEDSDDEESKTDTILDTQSKTVEIRESQDDEIHLAQPQKAFSDDLFSSQECTQKALDITVEPKAADTSLEDLGSQTFSILKSGTEIIADKKDVSLEKIDVICETQPCSDDNFEAIVGMCTGGFSENIVTPQAESSQLSQSQEIGDDVVALCTGKFYDNPFVSQNEGELENSTENKTEDESIAESNTEKETDKVMPELDPKPKISEGDNKLLKSILEELDDPEFDAPKPNKYFFNATKNQDKNNTETVENTQFKKKFVIESDDETNENTEGMSKKKKRRKRKLENRALQISDDEEEDNSDEEQDTFESEIEDNDRLVEYDSEENEVEIQPKPAKKKRRGTDFFEQEAELTSEDEWVGSGDEDEAGLDRMEREAGDEDTFHQGRLQRELGEIHMREVLDQDKREVRLLQELLFEDGDLGDGHRQRKFRWKNADGEEEIGTNADEYADTQEDEFESEEQWRKQRHEREMFLRKLQEKDEVDANVTINRNALIKATLASKPTSNTTLDISNLGEKSILEMKPKDLPEKKTINKIPSPTKPFIFVQQNYHNSLLTRGRGALARLAALATPLAGDDDGPKVNASSNRGNFVFAAITPDGPSKVSKRKADTAPETPRLLKKLKQESNKSSRSSLLDHL